MSVQLKLLNKSLVLFLIAITSCGRGTNAPKEFYHTELNCPGRGVILIRYASQQEVQNSITDFYNKKKASNGKENYTIISLPGNRSFKVENTPVEEVLECRLRQIPAPKPSAKAIKNMLYTPTYDFVSW